MSSERDESNLLAQLTKMQYFALDTPNRKFEQNNLGWSLACKVIHRNSSLQWLLIRSGSQMATAGKENVGGSPFVRICV